VEGPTKKAVSACHINGIRLTQHDGTPGKGVRPIFAAMEWFTTFDSQIPEHMEPFRYVFAGLEGHRGLAPWMWKSMIQALASLVLPLVPAVSPQRKAAGCGMQHAILVALD
jgi:hypothetical protein